MSHSVEVETPQGGFLNNVFSTSSHLSLYESGSLCFLLFHLLVSLFILSPSKTPKHYLDINTKYYYFACDSPSCTVSGGRAGICPSGPLPDLTNGNCCAQSTYEDDAADVRCLHLCTQRGDLAVKV